MAKKPPSELDYLRSDLRNYQAWAKVWSAQSGKNFDTASFSDLPKADAKRLLESMAKCPQVKKIGSRYQRTNAADLEGLKHFNDQVKEIQDKINHITSEKKDNKNMAINSKLNAPKPVVGTRASQAKRDQILAEARGIRANISEVKNDLSTSSEPEVVPDLHDRLQGSLLPVAGLAKNARIVKVSQGKSLALSTVSLASPVSVIGEGSALSGADLEISGNVVNFSKLSSRVAASQEIFEDAPAIVESAISDASRNVWSGVDDLIVSAVASDVGVAERNVAINSLSFVDINALCAAAIVEREDEPVLVFNSSFFRSVIADLLDAQGKELHQEGDQIYWNDFKIVLSDSLAGGSASPGDCVAIAGSIKKGVTVVERSPIQYERKDEILATSDKALLHISWRGGCGVQNPKALSRLVLV